MRCVGGALDFFFVLERRRLVTFGALLLGGSSRVEDVVVVIMQKVGQTDRPTATDHATTDAMKGLNGRVRSPVHGGRRRERGRGRRLWWRLLQCNNSGSIGGRWMATLSLSLPLSPPFSPFCEDKTGSSKGCERRKVALISPAILQFPLSRPSFISSAM